VISAVARIRFPKLTFIEPQPSWPRRHCSGGDRVGRVVDEEPPVREIGAEMTVGMPIL